MQFITKFSIMMGQITLLTVSAFWLVSSFIDSKTVVVIIGLTLVIMVFFITFLTSNNFFKTAEEAKKPEEGEAEPQCIPFDYIRRVYPRILLTFFQHEHPQTIACVLSHLKPDNAAIILQELSDDILERSGKANSDNG